jgi:signal transduction histidine kinase
VATLSSTAPLRANAQSLVLRLGIAAGVAALLIMAFGAWLVIASRRAALLRERVRHAEALEHLHEKTEKILDNIPTGVIALSDAGRISAINRALRERCPEEALGGALADAFPEAPAAVVARLQSLCNAARTADRVRSLHGERLALFGEEGQYSLHAVPLEPRFPEARVLLVVEDVTAALQVRSLASQLLRAEKLATTGVLAAGIAHEIGTPLGVVRGRAEYILGKLGPGHTQAAGLGVIVEQIDRVSRTIRQLLDFARVKAAQVRPIAVAPIARAVAELLRYEAERRKVALRVDAAEDLPPVAADPDQLQQVLVNLAMNALDACGEGGHVAIVATPARSAPDAAGGGEDWDRLRIEVVDDGCGIPEEHRVQVFDPFFTTKKRGQGTGLGLTMAAEIVRNHGAQIELESEPGKGTRVVLEWPAVSAKETGKEEQRGVG